MKYQKLIYNGLIAFGSLGLFNCGPRELDPNKDKVKYISGVVKSEKYIRNHIFANDDYIFTAEMEDGTLRTFKMGLTHYAQELDALLDSGDKFVAIKRKPEGIVFGDLYPQDIISINGKRIR